MRALWFGRLDRTRPNTRVLVVSTECMTENWYHGNERAYLITNCIFRVGASALILSNRRSDRKRATFQLSHLVRTHMGADDEAYDSVFQDQVRRQGCFGVDPTPLTRVGGTCGTCTGQRWQAGRPAVP